MKKTKNTKNATSRVAYITTCVFTFALTFAATAFIAQKSETDNPILFLIEILLFLLLAVFFLVINLIIHESGHYIFGKLTGYKFCSFRIFNFTFIKENGKTKIKKYMVLGTAGQCLMAPPEYNDNKFPVALYNLGGVIMNLAISIVGIVVLLLTNNYYMTIVFSALTLTSLYLTLSNGVPMRINGMPNDGYNVWLLCKDPYAKEAFWKQLYINEKMAHGVRLKDMDNELFEIKEDSDITNPIISTILVFKCNQLHDKNEFELAEEKMNTLLETVPSILELYKNELKCELLFYAALKGDTIKVNSLLEDGTLNKYIEATKSMPSRQRLLYELNLLVYKDSEKANAYFSGFEKIIKNYPYASEVESEKELILIINSKSKEIEKEICEDDI